jgi:hypothetical protein
MISARLRKLSRRSTPQEWTSTGGLYASIEDMLAQRCRVIPFNASDSGTKHTPHPFAPIERRMRKSYSLMPITRC